MERDYASIEEAARREIVMLFVELDEQARGDRWDIDEEFRKVASELISESKPLPPNIKRYVLKTLRPQSQAPPKTTRRNPGKDLQIQGAVAIAMSQGLRFTRNPAPKHDRHSACSLVAEVCNQLFDFTITESGIEKICRSYAGTAAPWSSTLS